MSIPSRESKLSRGRDAAALLGLAALALVLSPEPPPDRLLAVVAAFLVERRAFASALIQAAFALVLGAGAVVILALIVAKILDILGLRRARGAFRPRRRSWLASLAAYALVLAILAVARQGGGLGEGAGAGKAGEQGGAATGASASSAAVTVEEAPPPPLPRVPVLPLAVAGALIAGGVALVALHSRKGRGPAAPTPEAPEKLEAEAEDTEKGMAIAASRRRLESGGGIRESIIACYAEMCAIFARADAGKAGAARNAKSLTAREFAALLRSEGAGEPEIYALTAAFEKARYSNENCVEADRLSAIEALKVLELRYGMVEA